MKRALTTLSVLLSFLLSSTSWAALISINDVTASWQNPVPVDGISISNGTPTSTISWGTPSPGSGYVFTTNTPSGIIEVPPISDYFSFGSFTHNNFPIYPPSLTSVELRLDLGMTIDGTAVNTSFVYTFDHNETPNVGNGNNEISRDIVTISPPESGAFEVDDVLYTLELDFSQDGGQTTTNQFYTWERRANTAGIYGRFTSDIPVVPIPSTLVLLSAGFLGLMGCRKKIRK